VDAHEGVQRPVREPDRPVGRGGEARELVGRRRKRDRRPTAIRRAAGYRTGQCVGEPECAVRRDREPERLGSQVRPESITLWPAPPASVVSTEPTACYEAGPFVTVDAVNVEATLRAALPPGSWAATRSDNTVGSAVVTTLMYRVAGADPALVARLTSLRLDPNGRGFSPCPDATRPR